MNKKPSLKTMILKAEAEQGECANRERIQSQQHKLPPKPRGKAKKPSLVPVPPKKEKARRLEISTWLSADECAALDAVCRDYCMSRGAMILDVHRFCSRKKRITKRLDEIDETIARAGKRDYASKK